MARDTTKYLFNNNEYSKGKLVLAVIKAYVDDINPSFEELKEEFPDSLQGMNTILSEQELQNKKIEKPNSFKKKRFFENSDDVIVTSDDVKVYVSNQWGISEDPNRDNFTGFLNKATELGYEINIMVDNKILELFKQHENDPPNKWLKTYRERCQEVSDNKVVSFNNYTREFLENVWLKPANGIANVSPGFMSNLEFENLFSELPEITHKIISDPTSSTHDTINEWAQQAKTNNKFTSIKRGVINRVFSGAEPNKYTTILDVTKLKHFISTLNERYNLNIDLYGNWPQLNESLISVLREQGLQKKDVFLFNTFLWKLYEFIVDGKNVFNAPINPHIPSQLTEKINTIFYGPPGTGKTFNTVNAAIKILEPDFYDENKNDRGELKLKFDQYLDDGRIGFVTFHQSFSYEDFVEGLRAEADDDGNIQYFVQDGIFKQLCDKANKTENSTGIDESIQQLIEYLQEETLHLHTSSGKGFKITGTNGKTFSIKLDSSTNPTSASVVNVIKYYKGAKLNDIPSHSYVWAILEHLKSEYGLNDKPEVDDVKQPVVLIIDEINRGNTANIFGELITLIESSKRAGAKEALSVVLPYSKEKFSVPDNLYIIGTMNTADRSLALIDTALRRRFQFEEMLPQPELLSGININGVDVQKLLMVMNKRIALLYDREHALGHSFFLSLNKNSTMMDLRDIFEGQILPLLEEYFFEDWEKIRQVLGDPLKPEGLQIIKPDVNENEVSFLLGDDNMNIINSLYYRDHTALSNPQAYIAIYQRE